MTVGEKLNRNKHKDASFLLQKLQIPTGKRTTLITHQNKENHLTSIKS